MSATNGTQRFVPYLAYADAERALEFLGKAFGFEERYRMPMEDGRIGHAEMAYRGGTLYLASTYPEFGLASPRDLAGVHTQICCEVDDVDLHYAQARAAGATIAAAPSDTTHGDRMYRAVDPEGHRWLFSSPLK